MVELRKVELGIPLGYYRVYAPTGFKRYVFFTRLFLAIAALPTILTICLFTLIGALKPKDFLDALEFFFVADLYIIIIIATICLLVPYLCALTYSVNRNKYWMSVHQELLSEKRSQESANQAMEARRQMGKLISAVDAKEIGKKIVTNTTYNTIATGNSRVEQNVINGDYLRDSARIMNESGIDLEDALLIFAGYLDNLKLSEAQQAFNDLNKNMKDGSSRITLGSIWKGILEIVPDAVKLSEAAIAISKFFGLPF